MKPKTLLILTYVSLASCAAPEPRPDNQLVTASTAIEEATRAGAVEYASNELNRAQGKLLQARAAIQSKDYAAARSLAEQAEVDAKLAESKSQTAKTQQAAAELNERIRELRAHMLGRENELK
ncbi:MAG: DUF4398 domain-containing protein [Burkholderiales bacterium]